MWIVHLALRRPYTFVVGALLVVILGVMSALRMPTDILPELDIPVVSIIWNYQGLPPEEMERRFGTPYERAITTTVNDVEHIESQSLSGITVIRVYFQPGARIESAVAQLAATAQSILRIMPPGASAPFIVRYNAANVPVLQLALGGDSLSEQQLADLGTNGIRTRLATVRGASVPSPYGGRTRLINVDLDPDQLLAYGLSPTDVSDAVSAQNLVLPGGTAKIGEREYAVRLNGSPDAVEALNDLPLRSSNGALVRIRDVAQVRDGYAVQTNIVHRDGVRGALVTVLKSGGASTIDVVNRVREALPGILAALPSSLKVDVLADQSLFVKAALKGVVIEALIAACLTAAMILLFLGSWRSTLIVALSIPLSILCSVIVLASLGQTLNVMTLGGLALAVGVLVDDATVGIENIHRVQHDEPDIEQAILLGAGQIAVPTLVSTLAICIVFVPIFFLPGAAGSLFKPLAMAVVFAMLASYVISRTLVPTLVKYAMQRERTLAERRGGAPHGPFARLHHGFEARFEGWRQRYRTALAGLLAHPARVALPALLVIAGAGVLAPWLGREFFPAVDAGQIRLHLRAPVGTRVEETARHVARVEAAIRALLPEGDIASIIDNVGLSSTNSTSIAYSDNPTIGVTDADVLISLSPERRGETAEHARAIRRMLRRDFPELLVFFQSADIVGQILNAGLPAPVNVQVTGSDRKANLPIARFLERRLREIPGAVDVFLHQRLEAPQLDITVDRVRASGLAMSQRDVANDLLVSLASSGQAQPNVWLNPQNGVQYNVSVQTPQYRMTSVDALGRTPVMGPTGSGGGMPQLMANVATVRHGATLGVVSHYDVAPVFDVYANVQDRDLGAVAADVDMVLDSLRDSLRASLPRGTTLVMRGQVASMRGAYAGLAAGLAFAVVLVYLVMVINFQSWTDPLIISAALPVALAGVVWALFACGNAVSVPAFMGAIMSMGVATANGILVVAFANERRAAGLDAHAAALDAASTRLRPVIMTALAMIVGMLPMAFGLGEGAEQNAPLGRAVIGGLAFATVATLTVLPLVYARVHGGRQARRATAPMPAASPSLSGPS